MGIFDPNMIHISHKSIRTEEILSNYNIEFEIEVIDYNINTDIESVILFWKYSAEDGPFNELYLENGGDINKYFAIISSLNSNSLLDYYITATNELGNAVSHPNAGWHTFNTLSTLLGDLNDDGIINIQDIVLLVNLALNNQFQEIADINEDSAIDVLDIVLLVQLILEI